MYEGHVGKGLKPVDYFSGSRVGSPGAFQAMGQRWIRLVQPHRRAGHALQAPPQPLDVALQVVFERQTLKPVFHLIGYRLWV